MKLLLLTPALVAAVLLPRISHGQEPWLRYEGDKGSGNGRHVVLVSGDEEYRSEEALPQLARILSSRHGFDCTVLFAIDPQSGMIDPNQLDNIPGLEHLDTADLMIIFTRYRKLPDDQMAHIDRYLKLGKPVIGIRTSTHAFNFPAGSPFEHYSNSYAGDKQEWSDGFGRLVLGERWVAHHGKHKHESTRGRIATAAKDHPVLRGIEDGAIWGPSDVYTVRLPLPGDAKPLVLGEVVTRRGNFDETDANYGMRPTDGPAVEGEKNDPMMPIVWIKSYKLPGGAKGRAITSTIGASTDFANDALRRLLVNSVYYLTGIGERIPIEGTNAELVGDYQPTKYEFRNDEYWLEKSLRPAELR